MAIDIKIKQVSADDLANKELLERTNSKTIRLVLFGTEANAQWAAERALRRSSYPFIEGTVRFHHTAFKLKIGDLFKLNYSQYGIVDMICRVMSINLGDIESEDIEVNFIQDSEYYSEEITLPPTETFPPRIDYSLDVLTPAYIVDSSYDLIGDNVGLLPLVGRAKGSEIGYDLYMSNDGGTSYSYLKSYESYCLHGTLVEAITEHYPTVTDKIFPITVDFSLSAEAENIETITRANLFANDNLAIIFDGSNYGEIIAFQTVTPDSTVTGRVALTGLLRGKFDTQMRSWPIGSDVFFINAAAIESFNDPSFFPEVTKYFKMVPYNSRFGGQLDEAEAIEYTVTGRGKAPYPPANLRANDVGLDDIGEKPQYTSDIDLIWTPNLRGGGAGIGVPGTVLDPGQTYEGYYLIEVYAFGSLLRTVTALDDLEYTYTEAMQLSDNGQLSLRVDFSVYNYLEYDGLKYKSEPLTISVYRSGATTTTTTSSTTSSSSTTV